MLGLGTASLQIQDGFAGQPLDILARAGLGVYEWVPDFRERCPVCDGQGCAVRHGLYRRRVVDRGGRRYEHFPVPRFRCRRRGTRPAEAVTFSVLPVELVPRRRASLPLMLWILRLLLAGGHTVHDALDALADSFSHRERPWLPDPPVIHRIVTLFAAAAGRLSDEPGVPSLPQQPGESAVRRRARQTWTWLGPPPRAAPTVLGFHQRRFPQLLWARRATPR